ncbi:hypothetical protein FTUN_8878 [Frigoriglobus tundricola]|uniref:Uncharacterized protein n=1 Tax=Frigoriglobus tundricola TaxID=2774151 RepID=A0A6M5Z4S6_9BACT|nr:hypothetical protein FTUN_8878 [Frigoriglobus tundricola]
MGGGLLGGFVGGRVAGERDAAKDEKEGKGGVRGQLEAGADGVSQALRFAGDVVQNYGERFQKVAQGDAVGALNKAVEGAAHVVEQIPVVGKPLAEGMTLARKALQAFKDTVDAFASRGREISGYNGATAAAVARQDVTRTLTDIREAQVLGDKYAKLIDGQTRFEETLKAGLLPLKEFVLDVLTKWMDKILEYMIQGLELLDKLNPFGTILGDMAASARETRDLLRGDGGPGFGSGSSLVDAWLRAPLGTRPAPGERLPRTPAASASPCSLPAGKETSWRWNASATRCTPSTVRTYLVRQRKRRICASRPLMTPRAERSPIPSTASRSGSTFLRRSAESRSLRLRLRSSPRPR